MDDLLDIAKDTWEQVGLGKVPLVVGASITNAVFAAFEAIECRLRSTFGSVDPETLRSKCICVGHYADNSLWVEREDDPIHESEPQQMLEGLGAPWRLLVALQRGGPPKPSDEPPTDRRLASHLTLRRSEKAVAGDTQCLGVLLQDMAKLIMPESLCTKCRIIRLSSPVYAELGLFLTKDKEDSNGLRCCYGLRLLLESYKGSLFAPETKFSPSTCRLHALQFAQGAISDTRAVLNHSSMPCRCHGTLAYHIENLNTDLQAFIHSKMFDFYFQAPWTCGCHELDILEAMFYYGLRLLIYRNYIGAIVHTYNVLRQLNQIQAVPLLDGLVDAFGEMLFPSGCPRRNFKASWVRFMGARLRFKSHTSDHKSGCHSMAIPAHTAQATAGFGSRKEAKDPRFEYRRISILHYTKLTGYHLDEATWNQICSQNSEDDKCSKGTKPKVCGHHRRHSQLGVCGHGQRLQCLQAALDAECCGAFPVARINIFKVFLSCVQVVSVISDKCHGDQAKPGQNCLCFIEPLLAAADRFQSIDDVLRPLDCKDLVVMCRDAIKSILDGTKLDQFLWQLM